MKLVWYVFTDAGIIVLVFNDTETFTFNIYSSQEKESWRDYIANNGYGEPEYVNDTFTKGIYKYEK